MGIKTYQGQSAESQWQTQQSVAQAVLIAPRCCGREIISGLSDGLD
ncbi:MAG: hypothetical protein IPQ12_03185 [Polaromonas sp.]|nr:hypothetical protein [Polaromonas sp.]